MVIQLLREVAERMRPPRALFVPFKHGYPYFKDTREDPDLESIRADPRFEQILKKAERK